MPLLFSLYFTSFVFYIFTSLDFTFSHLLYSTFLHLYICTFSHLFHFWVFVLFIFPFWVSFSAKISDRHKWDIYNANNKYNPIFLKDLTGIDILQFWLTIFNCWYFFYVLPSILFSSLLQCNVQTLWSHVFVQIQ